MFRQTLTAKLERRLKNVVSCVGVDVHGRVRTEKVEPTAWLIGTVSLLAQKSSKKVSDAFDAHCVDSWVLAYQTIGGADVVDNRDIFCISPIPIIRRQLHRQNPQKGGKRPRYGGTTWNGLVKNTLVHHAKHGLTRISGFGKQGISLYSLRGERLCQNAKMGDFKLLTRLNFNYRNGHSSQT